MISLIIILFGAIIALLTHIYTTQYTSASARAINGFPGSKMYPILGNFLNLNTSHVGIFNYFRQAANEFQSTWKIWIGHYPMLNITTVEDAEILLTSTKQIKKAFFYKFMHDWLGTGLLTSTDKKWQQRRKLLTPSFHFNILRKFTETFIEHSENLVKDLEKECEKPYTNISDYIYNSTLVMICETAMGTTLEPGNKEQKVYFKAIHDMAYMLIYRIVTPWIHNKFIFNLLPIGWKHKSALNYLHNFTTRVIKEREANFKDIDLTKLDKDEDELYKRKKLAMLDLLLSAKKNQGSIDYEGIREEVDTFMFEGHDTTSVGICFALMLLANERKHQDLIAKELHDIFGDSKRLPTQDDLQKMQYLELCIKESLRLYPSVPTIGRDTIEDLKLSIGTVPAGVTVNVHIYDLHRNPKYFPDPEKYDPLRFLPENCVKRNPFAYVPFSAGPRNCIGQKFALLEMKCIISAIIRNYILEPIDTPDTVKIRMDLVLRNEGPINVKLKPRTNK